MSGLYNAVFGVEPNSGSLLQVIGLDPGAIPRFRDVYIEDGQIVVHTRTGGGNREFYDEKNDENPDGPWNETMRENANYVRDEDEDFDCTYANFYFKVPDDFVAAVKQYAEDNPAVKPSDKWQALFAALDAK